MRKLHQVWKFSMLLSGAGFFSLTFLLFLHPLDPARFIQAALHLSDSAGSLASPGSVAMFAFWTACAVFTLGFAGIFYAFLNRRLRKPVAQTESRKYSDSDECEENWMFI
jgi:hypothetical protein